MEYKQSVPYLQSSPPAPHVCDMGAHERRVAEALAALSGARHGELSSGAYGKSSYSRPAHPMRASTTPPTSSSLPPSPPPPVTDKSQASTIYSYLATCAKPCLHPLFTETAPYPLPGPTTRSSRPGFLHARWHALPPPCSYLADAPPAGSPRRRATRTR